MEEPINIFKVTVENQNGVKGFVVSTNSHMIPKSHEKKIDKALKKYTALFHEHFDVNNHFLNCVIFRIDLTFDYDMDDIIKTLEMAGVNKDMTQGCRLSTWSIEAKEYLKDDLIQAIEEVQNTFAESVPFAFQKMLEAKMKGSGINGRIIMAREYKQSGIIDIISDVEYGSKEDDFDEKSTRSTYRKNFLS